MDITIFIIRLLCSSKWSLTTGYQNRNLFYNISNIKTLWKENLMDVANCKVARINLSSFDQMKTLLKRGSSRKTFTTWAEIVTPWLSMQGCYLGYGKKSPDNPHNTKESSFSKVACLSKCNFTAFVMSKQSCLCLSQVKIFKENECSSNNFDMFKRKTATACQGNTKQSIKCRCMCIYKLYSPTNTGSSGNCKTFLFNDTHYQPNFHKTNCESKYPYLIRTRSLKFALKPEPVTWFNAFEKSQSEGVSILKYDSINQYKSNISEIIQLHTKYWIGSYQSYFKIQTKKFNECLAVEARQWNIEVKYIPCSTKLPVLCQINISYYNNSMSTILADHNVTMDFSDHSKGNLSSVDLIIAGATIGTIILFIVLTGLCFLRRCKVKARNGLVAIDLKQLNLQKSTVDDEEKCYEMCTAMSSGEPSAIPYVDIDINSTGEYSSLNIRGANVNTSQDLNDYDSMIKIRSENMGEYGINVNKMDLNVYDSMVKIRSENDGEYQ